MDAKEAVCPVCRIVFTKKRDAQMYCCQRHRKRAAARRQYASHPQQSKRTKYAWRDANLDKWKAARARYRKKHPEKKREKDKKRYQKKRAESPRAQYVDASGWPVRFSLREIAILNLLAAVGVPMTAREILKPMGIIGQNTLYRLVQKGFVSVLPRSRRVVVPRRRGGVAYANQFTLSPVALSILEERAKCRSEKS